MLGPITNWSDLRRALRRAGLEIYLCEDCHNIWLGSAKETPVRCSQRDCRAFANSPLRGQVGRPPEATR
jgi:hypothetical protein